MVAVSVEDGRLIDAFVAWFRPAKARSNYRANLRAWFRWTAQIGIGELEAECARGERSGKTTALRDEFRRATRS